MNVASLHVAPQLPERWLTFEEAAEALERSYGFRTAAGTLENLANYGKPLKNGRPPMPSAKHFGKRQVQLSRVLTWLADNGYVEQAA